MPRGDRTAITVSPEARDATNQLALTLSAIIGVRITHSEAIQIANNMIRLTSPRSQVMNAAKGVLR